jgi:uncharacterized membrane protein YfcA
MIMIILYLLTCVTGSVIQTVCGFGFAVFVLSVFPYYMPNINEGVAISNLLSMSLSVIMVCRLRKKTDLKMILPSLLGFFIVSGILIFMFSDKPDDIYRKALGVVLVLMSGYFHFFSNKLKIRPGLTNSVIAGSVSGALGGLFGMSGPPMAAYLISACEDDSGKYLANMQLFLGLCNLYSVAARAAAGTVTAFVLKYWLIGLGAVIAGSVIGRATSGRISLRQLRIFVYAVMAASGLILIFL